MTTEKQIQAVVRRIVEGYAPDKLYLLGAYACGVPTENSDLALLLSKEQAATKRTERASTIRTLLRGTDVPAMNILIRTPDQKRRALSLLTADRAREAAGSFVRNSTYPA